MVPGATGNQVWPSADRSTCTTRPAVCDDGANRAVRVAVPPSVIHAGAAVSTSGAPDPAASTSNGAEVSGGRPAVAAWSTYPVPGRSMAHPANAATPAIAARTRPPLQMSVAPVGFDASESVTSGVLPGPAPTTSPVASMTVTVGWPVSGAPASAAVIGHAYANADAGPNGSGPRSRRPAPKVEFGTGLPSGTACERSQSASSTGVRPGRAWRTWAAAPVTNGADSLVPQNGSSVAVGAQSAATRSGFTRPSSVGPRELYGSISVGWSTLTAPTASIPGFVLSAGVGRVPAAIW